VPKNINLLCRRISQMNHSDLQNAEAFRLQQVNPTSGASSWQLSPRLTQNEA